MSTSIRCLALHMNQTNCIERLMAKIVLRDKKPSGGVQNIHPATVTLEQKCTRFLHACSALCKCANWLCRTCTPHHTVAGISSVSLTQSPFAFPSHCRCGPSLTSYMPGRAVPSRARVHESVSVEIGHRYCSLLLALTHRLNSLGKNGNHTFFPELLDIIQKRPLGALDTTVHH
jgi:hypothetical protein